MKPKNILCCINDYPLFSYRPLENKPNVILEQNIVNFLTGKKTGPWISKETTYESNVLFHYYEVSVEKACKMLSKGKKGKNGNIETFCLSFLNFFFEENFDNLINFLRSTNDFTEEELTELKNSLEE